MRIFRHRHAVTGALAILSGLAATGAQADEAFRIKAATLGAQGAGYNYESYQYCGASVGDLKAIKDIDRSKFAAAGAGFDPAFADGVAESVSKRNMAISDLGEAKYRSSVCPNALKALQAKLARK